MKEQIEEMALIICGKKDCTQCISLMGLRKCGAKAYAERLYNAGYRKQKYGKWQKRTFIIFDSEKVGYNCSECNTTWDAETKFCPNCGAKMKGGAE